MRLPFAGNYPITQTYEEHNQRRIENGWTYYNGGIDYGVPEGTPIYAVVDGAVSKIETLNTGYGNVIKIDHGNGLQTLYAHLSYIVVSLGQMVSMGQMIGRSGNTGNSTGPHLHFEVRQDGKAIDPQPLLDSELIGNPEQLTGKKVISKDQTWNLRATANGEKIGLLYGGAEVDIIETTGDWCKVSITGYVHRTAFDDWQV